MQWNVLIAKLLLVFVPMTLSAQVTYSEPDNFKLGSGSFVVMCQTTAGIRFIASVAPREHWFEKVKDGDRSKTPFPIVSPSIANIMFKKCMEKMPRYSSLNSIALHRETSVNDGPSYPVVALSVFTEESYCLNSNSEIMRFMRFFQSSDINDLDKGLLTADHEAMRAFEMQMGLAPDTDPMKLYFIQRIKDFTQTLMFCSGSVEIF